MDSLRVGGLISGLDTNGIVDTYAKQAKLPLVRLQNQYDLKSLEKDVYTDFDTKLEKIKTNLFSFKLESTFKTKTVSSTNTSILSATALPSAETGSYSVQVLQRATQAYWHSNYTSIAGIKSGAGVDSLSGSPTEHLEGVHSISVNATNFTLTDTFTPDNLGIMTKITGGNISTTTAMSNGTFQDDDTLTFTLDIDSTTFTTDSINIAVDDDINSLTNKIEKDLNAKINTHFNTTSLNYLAVRADYDGSNWQISVYKASLEDFSISNLSSTNTSGNIDLNLTTTSQTTATTIKKYYLASDTTDLLNKINNTASNTNDSSLIRGVTFNSTSGLTDGTIKLLQDATLNTQEAVKTTVTSNTLWDGTTGSGLDVTAVGLENAGLSKTPDSNTNGTFTINNKQITIDDYTALSINDVLAKINSSGAGVTATYDSTTDKITLTNNETGSTNISLGNYSDTSNILSILRLTSAEGAVTSLGSDAGTVDPDKKLTESGISNTITSGIFTINGISIYVDASSDSLNDVINKVNNSGAGITMMYDSISDKIKIKSDTKERIKFGSSSDTSTFLSAVKLTDNYQTEQSLGYEGQDAILKVDGITYVRDNNKVDDVIAGVTLNLNSSSSESVTLNIETDTTKAVNAIATFIQKYNEVMAELDPPELSKDDEKYLQPLSEDDKATMSTDAIDEYNKKWKEFNTYEIIRKSAELKNLKNDMRAKAVESLTGVNSKFSNLADLGIDIAGGTDFNTLNKGKLLIDSQDYDEILKALEDNTKFMDNLKNYTNDVYTFFASNENNNTTTFTPKGKGFARVYENHIKMYADDDGLIGMKIKPGGTIDQAMETLLKSYDDTNRRVEQQLERLWAQFTAMEKTLADLQDQSSYLSSLTTQTQK